MLQDLLAKTYYDNTVAQWATALGIILGTLLVTKVLYWIAKSVIGRLTAKTETSLDDVLLDMIEEPVIFAATVGGIWYGLSRLTLPETWAAGISNAVHFLIVIAATWFLARLANAIVTEYLAPLAAKSDTDLDDQLLPILKRGLSSAVWMLGIIVALNNVGVDVAALIAGLGIGGLALAMAAKDTVSNIFGGFTIFTDRPFRLGDRVRVGGFDGTVEEIGLRSTRIRTLAGTLVTLPNAQFAGSAVENVSAEPNRKVVLNLGLTYDTQPEAMEKALALLQEIAAANAGTEEKILTAFNAFGDFAMNLMLVYYIKKEADILATQTAMNTEILSRFNAEGLEFAFPTQTLFTKKLD